MEVKFFATAALCLLALAPAAMAQSPASRPAAPAAAPAAKTEFIDIRWDNVDRMCVIYPDGRVDFFGKDLKDIPRPDDANKRAFYLTIEMNRLAAQGYEFVAMISDEIIMKRTVR